MYILNCVTFFVLLVVSNECRSLTIRQTTNGPVEGVVLTSILSQKYYAFMGIPYAEPPITGMDPHTGQIVDRRFKATELLKRKWKYPFKANKKGPSCIPFVLNLPLPKETSEDCLHLDVYVPVNGCKKKTVLVFIHGGGFSYEDTSYRPDFLLTEDNVVVFLRYRLGVFGFLDMDCDEYSGNMGLKDQQLALMWIYENIENFSGNKYQILLFGESAGGASVHFHMLSCESQKYFTRALCISSSAFCYYALNPAGNLNKIMECTQIYDKPKLIEYLKTANSSDLSKCYPYQVTDYNNITWVPTIESPTAYRPFITKLPEDIYNSCEAPAMDAMFGFNNKEGILYTMQLPSTVPLIKCDLNDTDIQLPFRGFNKATHPNEYLQALRILKTAYYSSVTNSKQISERNIQILSDLVLAEGVLRAAVYQTEANNKHIGKCIKPKTYLYRFSVDSTFSYLKSNANVSYTGATHVDDLCYYIRCHAFDPKYECHLKRNDKSAYDIKRMVKIITNFARTGNPSIECDTPFTPNRSKNEVFCQEISNSIRTSVTYNIKEQLHYEAWRKIEEIYRKYIKCYSLD